MLHCSPLFHSSTAIHNVAKFAQLKTSIKKIHCLCYHCHSWASRNTQKVSTKSSLSKLCGDYQRSSKLIKGLSHKQSTAIHIPCVMICGHTHTHIRVAIVTTKIIWYYLHTFCCEYDNQYNLYVPCNVLHGTVRGLQVLNSNSVNSKIKNACFFCLPTQISQPLAPAKSVTRWIYLKQSSSWELNRITDNQLEQERVLKIEVIIERRCMVKKYVKPRVCQL